MIVKIRPINQVPEAEFLGEDDVMIFDSLTADGYRTRSAKFRAVRELIQGDIEESILENTREMTETAVENLQTLITEEAEIRRQADEGLQSQIDSLGDIDSNGFDLKEFLQNLDPAEELEYSNKLLIQQEDGELRTITLCKLKVFMQKRLAERIKALEDALIENGLMPEPEPDVPPTPPEAPIVSAGSNKTIQLPTNSVTLSGGVISEGSIESYLWEMVSGPNTPTIGTPDQAETGVTGLVAGVYVFRLTVTDNFNQSGSDTTTVTVNVASGSQTFNSNGTFVVPFGVTSIKVTARAGGGGGGGASSTIKGSGGGGGGVFAAQSFNVTPGQSINITLGAGGQGGSRSSTVVPTAASNGTDGGNTVIGNLITLTGGKGGVTGGYGGAGGSPDGIAGNAGGPTNINVPSNGGYYNGGRGGYINEIFENAGQLGARDGEDGGAGIVQISWN